MKKLLAILLVGTLVLSGGCAPAAAPSQASGGESDSSSQQSRPGNMDGDQRRMSGFAGGNRQAGVMGKIVAVSENEITLEIGVMSRPDSVPSSGESVPPNSGEALPNNERPGDAPMPRGGPPAGGMPGGTPRGGGFPWSGELEYTGEEASYVITEPVTVTKGMGETGETLSLADLTVGDVVQLFFDESVRLVSIQVIALEQDGE